MLRPQTQWNGGIACRELGFQRLWHEGNGKDLRESGVKTEMGFNFSQHFQVLVRGRVSSDVWRTFSVLDKQPMQPSNTEVAILRH